MYCVAKSTALCIIHHGVSVLREHPVSESIRFLTGPELSQVIRDYEALCGLPYCGGGIDGTFMPIVKPTDFGDSYWCYKHFCAIILLGCVDARGIFTSVNSGRPGSVGDLHIQTFCVVAEYHQWKVVVCSAKANWFSGCQTFSCR